VGNPALQEDSVGLSGTGRGGAKLAQNGLGVLPRTGDGPQDSTVTRPGEAIQGAEVGNHLRPEGVEMEVADEFQEIRLLFHHDGLVPVLEEVADAFVAPVEGPPRTAG